MSEDATLDDFVKTETEESSNLELGPIEVDIPDEWESRELSNVFDLITGNNYSGDYLSDDDNGGRIFLTLKSVNKRGGFNWDSLKYYTGEVNERETVEPGELLIANTDVTQDGDIVGYSIRVPDFDSEKEIAASMDLSILRPTSNNTNLPYVEYLLQTDYIHSRMRAFSAGSTVLHLNTDLVESLSLPLPPLSEQQKIATVLDNVDKGIQKTEEIISQVEAVRTGFVHGLYDSDEFTGKDGRSSSEEKRIESILESRRRVWAEAEKERQQRRGDFDGSIDESKYSPPLDLATQRLPELPDGWLWSSLDTFVAYDIDYRGKTPPYSDSGIPVISSGNIQNGEIVFEDDKYVSEETYEDWLDRGVPREGDLLVTTEAPVGKVTLYPEGTYLPTRRIITFRTVGVENRYLQAAIRHPYVQNYLTAQSGGSTVGRILKDHLLKTPIPLPPREEQQQIADTLKDFDKRIANESEYKSRLKRLKRGLMQDLLSGTVRTTDTNIEVPDEIAQHG